MRLIDASVVPTKYEFTSEIATRHRVAEADDAGNLVPTVKNPEGSRQEECFTVGWDLIKQDETAEFNCVRGLDPMKNIGENLVGAGMRIDGNSNQSTVMVKTDAKSRGRVCSRIVMP
jgi:hypothetical protein